MKIKKLFDFSFYQNILILVIGLIIGIPFGIWTNSILSNLNEQNEKYQLVLGLTEAFERNKKILDKIHEGGDHNYSLISTKLDLVFLQNTSEHKYKYLSIEDCKKIDIAVYHLQSINHDITTVGDYLITKESEINYDDQLYGLSYLRGSIHGHITVVLDYVEDATEVLRKHTNH